MDVNDNAGPLIHRGVPSTIASKLAPTGSGNPDQCICRFPNKFKIGESNGRSKSIEWRRAAWPGCRANRLVHRGPGRCRPDLSWL
ncbi:hypothetical protein C1886_09030 [Pseudomonas sp. FW300-N1A1]|nr:hypothetical protein C1886_09030 [Pseudomonas sp. FW300-N1A1]